MTELVSGCDAILHVAGEKGRMERMHEGECRGDECLAEAAERVGVKVFCYVSSVVVYGSGLQRTMTEDAPLLTVARDVRSGVLGARLCACLWAKQAGR